MQGAISQHIHSSLRLLPRDPSLVQLFFIPPLFFSVHIKPRTGSIPKYSPLQQRGTTRTVQTPLRALWERNIPHLSTSQQEDDGACTSGQPVSNLGLLFNAVHGKRALELNTFISPTAAHSIKLEYETIIVCMQKWIYAHACIGKLYN